MTRQPSGISSKCLFERKFSLENLAGDHIFATVPAFEIFRVILSPFPFEIDR